MGSRLRKTAASRLLRIAAVVTVALPLAGISSFEALFAPSAKLWPRWETHDPASAAHIDHGQWEDLLETYVTTDHEGLHRIDYDRLNMAGRRLLDSYIDNLSRIDIDRYNRAEQKAFWVNLYNALTVRVISQHYPVASIRDIDISPGWFADGPWDKPLISINGEELSLNDIEHRILRPIWRDPRVHYAVNCAAVGCPNLQDMAFTGANLHELMDQAATDYVNSPRAINLMDSKLAVSSIYVWFQEDFGGNDEGVIAHLSRYAKPGLADRLAGVMTLSDHYYDWSLNDYRREARN